MIEWNEQFRTGSDTLDQQHRMLIDKINYLECLLTETNPSREVCDSLIQLLDFLDSYSRTHFRFEEECMERHRCPAHEKNKEAHKAFTAFLMQFKEETRHRGFRPDVLRTLHQTMSLWIAEHILQLDTQLKPCLKAVN